jgi:polar amino acid transport system substrate-binding protein
MKKIIVLYLLATLVSPMPVWAQEMLVYGYDEDYMPWEKNVEGVPTGINIDIMTIVAERLGMGIRFESYPFKRVLVLLKSGDIDIAGGLEKNPERAMFADFLEPAYQKTRKIFVMKKGSTKVLEKYEDLYRLKVGLRAGTKQFEPFDSDEGIVKVETNSVDQLFSMLLFDRYDVAVGGNIQLLYAAKTQGYADKIQIADYRLDLGAGGHFALSQKSSFVPRKGEIQAILLDMFNSGQIDTIIASYLN